MRPVDRQLRASVLDLNRAGRDYPTPSPYYPTLMKITDASAIAGQDKRWLYTVVEATIDTGASYSPALSVNTGSYSALSVSELTNNMATNTYSYGVAKANVPAGFSAVQIPVGTYVMCVPYWRSDSSSIYLIINTQAIDGTCT